MFQADYFYMSQALMLAKRGALSVSPNPMVGCVIVKNGQIIGEGWHRFAGDKHAEIYALDQAGDNAQGATVYVTLEPCCHIGRTGACTERLIKAQVAKVVIASIDPNPQVAGKGIKRLQQANVVVETGLMCDEAIAVNKIFFHCHQYKRPYVIAKWGMSLDGQMVTHPLDSKQITDKASQQQVHNLRNKVDAIMIGSQTLINDNPKLTVRCSDAKLIKQPLRIVLSKTAQLPLDASLFNDGVVKSIVITSNLADKQQLKNLQNKGVECIEVPLNHGEIDLKEALKILAQRGITSVLVEGGRTVINAFFEAQLVDEVQSYIAPLVIAQFNQKKFINIEENGFLSEDYYCIGKIKKLGKEQETRGNYV
ncbi:bifunctional diaminohydroxyphosphoribosylaminopyrimidine deaminase/5-amino-6-(5-phosphoribosylamino)uracil reductase RibD [Cysteiniphilum halobium]|uniref:bifunctional diaminohydroxyphosphoribosylaminopyrimidine deaminase/5-amino-6-(5-phosphoribosylamino)uracil reductase RibD n=1 Tax=Cysteiniphilum halobium TaxID=2219059 RepID=UPI003F84A8C6